MYNYFLTCTNIIAIKIHFNSNLISFNNITSKTIDWIKPNKTSFILFFGCGSAFQEKIIKNQKINHFKNYIYAHVLYIYILFYFIFDLISLYSLDLQKVTRLKRVDKTWIKHIYVLSLILIYCFWHTTNTPKTPQEAHTSILSHLNSFVDKEYHIKKITP